MRTISALLVVWAIIAAPVQAADRKPNIVFIMADDLGINDLGCYGRSEHRTPNLDKLASRGIRFTSAYAAQSVCSPTRAAIVSGLAPARLHLTTFLPGRRDAVSQMLLHPNINQQLPADVITLPQRLKAIGYVTGAVGKWHLGNKGSQPTDRGFDFYHAGKALTTPSATEGGKGEYDLTQAAEGFIEKNKDRPFFLYLCHNNPHIALAAKEELVAKHKDAFNPTYAAMIETLDDAVGRVLAKIDALGLSNDTIIIFTSDNGGVHILEGGVTPTHNTPFRAGKGFLYEGGLRVPVIVCWPGKIKAGQTTAEPIISTDWTPTLLAAAGFEKKEAFDGVSLLGLLTKGIPVAPRPLYWHLPHYTNQGSRPSGAIREGNWKLIEHYENGQCELFDLAQDIGEATDVSAREPARVADLRGKLEKWRRDMGAQSNLPNPDFSGAWHKKAHVDTDVSKLAPDKSAQTTTTRLAPWRTAMDAVISPKKAPPSGAGAIFLLAKDAKIHGDKLRFEPQPQKDTLGFWVVQKDWVEWTFSVPHSGQFEVEILQACGKGSGGAEIEVTVGEKKLTTKVEETGHFQRFIPRTIGAVNLKEGENVKLTVKALSKPGGAVMDLRRIVLRSSQ